VRRLVAFLLLGVALAPACAGAQRPEGIVERWLVSLNQGAAGEPFRYADDEATAMLAPDWDTRDPGAYDVIRVGTPSEGGSIPFRLTGSDGGDTGGLAFVATRELVEGTESVVIAVTLQVPAPDVRAVWSRGTGASSWILAALAAIVLAGSSVLLLGAAHRRAH
jgi:hypothetical protein